MIRHSPGTNIAPLRGRSVAFSPNRRHPPDVLGSMANTSDEGRSPLTIKKRVLFSIVLLGIVAAVLEGGAQAYLRLTKGFDGKHFLQYEFDPYKNVVPQRGFVDTRGVKHNEQGFRREDIVPIAKPPDTYRIFLMGGSTAYGTGGLWPHLQTEFAVIPDSATISAYLEGMLGERFPGKRVEVINAAIASTWTHHHLIYLNQTILRYDPDMVLFLDGFNDFYHFAPGHEQFASYAYSEHSTVIMGPPTLNALAYGNAWWLSRKSAFAYTAFRGAQTVGRLIRGKPKEDPIDVDVALAGLAKTFPDNALAMIERTALILRHEGVRGVFMIQPMLVLESKRDMPPVERELFQFNVESYLPNYEDFIVRAVPLVSAMEEKAVTELGGHFMDLTSIYEEAEGQIFTDYTHLTPLGNRILAERVAEDIFPQIVDDLESRDNRAAGFDPDGTTSVND